MMPAAGRSVVFVTGNAKKLEEVGKSGRIGPREGPLQPQKGSPGFRMHVSDSASLAVGPGDRLQLL